MRRCPRPCCSCTPIAPSSRTKPRRECWDGNYRRLRKILNKPDEREKARGNIRGLLILQWYLKAGILPVRRLRKKVFEKCIRTSIFFNSMSLDLVFAGYEALKSEYGPKDEQNKE